MAQEEHSLKVFTASITSNPEIRKQCQRAVMMLEGLSVPCDFIDVCKPGNEQKRSFMREHAVNQRQKNPLPPQFFYDEEYLGNYLDFEEAVEMDRIAEFLRLIPDERWTRSMRKGTNNDENNAPTDHERNDIKG